MMASPLLIRVSSDVEAQPGCLGDNLMRPHRTQAVAAWVAAFSRGLPNEQVRATRAPWDEIIDLSVHSRDDHAIKFTEACHRLNELRPSQAFRAAASDWVHRVVETRNWSAAKLVDAGIRTRLAEA
jgi:hypothetical protein